MTKDELKAQARDFLTESWAGAYDDSGDEAQIEALAALLTSVAVSARAEALSEAEQECEDVAKLGLVLGDPKYAVGAGACLGRIRALAAKET